MAVNALHRILAESPGHEWALAQDISTWIEIGAISVIAIGVLITSAFGLYTAARAGVEEAHSVFKTHIARSLLIGLDLLIAADIIRTVTVEPTVENVGTLGLLVVVRTFLSWALVVEAENHWPWQAHP